MKIKEANEIFKDLMNNESVKRSDVRLAIMAIQDELKDKNIIIEDSFNKIKELAYEKDKSVINRIKVVGIIKKRYCDICNIQDCNITSLEPDTICRIYNLIQEVEMIRIPKCDNCPNDGKCEPQKNNEAEVCE